MALASLTVPGNDLKGGNAAKPIFVLPERARVYDLGMVKLASLREGADGRTVVARQPRVRSGRKTSLDVHYSADQQFYVLEPNSRCDFWPLEFSAEIEATAKTLPYASPGFLAGLATIYTKYDSTLLRPPPLG